MMTVDKKIFGRSDMAYDMVYEIFGEYWQELKNFFGTEKEIQGENLLILLESVEDEKRTVFIKRGQGYTELTFYENNSRHHETGPAHLLFTGNLDLNSLADFAQISEKCLERNWYINDVPHREDGPAKMSRITASDNFSEMWFLNGYDVTDRIRHLATEFGFDLSNLTDEDKVLLKLYVGG